MSDRERIREWLGVFRDPFTPRQVESLEDGIVATINAERAAAEARVEGLREALKQIKFEAANADHMTLLPDVMAHVWEITRLATVALAVTPGPKDARYASTIAPRPYSQRVSRPTPEPQP